MNTCFWSILFRVIYQISDIIQKEEKSARQYVEKMGKKNHWIPLNYTYSIINTIYNSQMSLEPVDWGSGVSKIWQTASNMYTD